MRALFLSPHYPPDVASTGQLVADLVEDFVAAGHEAHVVAAEPSYVGGLGNNGFAPVRRENRNGQQIRWIRSPKVGRRGVWSRLLPFAGYSLGAAGVAGLTRGLDVVYALSTPPLMTGALSAVLGGLKRVPFVYNLQDVYPDIAVALGVLRDGPVTRMSRRVESVLRRRAAAVTVLADDMAKVVRDSDAGVRRLEVIPNWIDTQQVRPVAHGDNAFRKEHGLEDGFVLLYSGNLGMAHGLEVLPEVAERLRGLERLVILVVGEGPAKAWVQQQVDQRRLGNVRFLPYQPKERLSESLSAADASLILQREEALGLLVPSKLYGIMASGRPAVAAVPQAGEVARVLREFDCGVWARPGDAESIARAVESLYHDPGMAQGMGERARACVVERFDRRVCTGKYIALFEELVAGNRGRA